MKAILINLNDEGVLSVSDRVSEKKILLEESLESFQSTHGLLFSMDEVSSFPMILRIIDLYLGSHYPMKVEGITLTEKNKGKEFNSFGVEIQSSFIISPGESLPNPIFNDIYSKYLFTLYGFDIDTLASLFETYPLFIHSTYEEDYGFLDSFGDNPPLSFGYLYAFNEQNSCVFAPFSITPKKALEFQDSCLYGNFMTRYAQIQAYRNISISFNQEYCNQELDYLTKTYKNFLFSILIKYFIMTIYDLNLLILQPAEKKGGKK